jgi:diguanylate cyclase (GGDEF)-like protein
MLRAQGIAAMSSRTIDVIGRSELLNEIAMTLKESRRDHHPCSLILFSIDRFRLINGRFGHSEADSVLQRVAASTRQFLRDKGVFGRWGGDEFMCVLPRTDAIVGHRLAEQLRQCLINQVMAVGSGVTTITASFGISCHPENGTDPEGLLVAAEEALYTAKQSGRNRVVHATILNSPVFSIGGLVETALREERVMPAYQPIVDLNTGYWVAEEALARIITTDEKVLVASEFIDAATQLQLTHKIDHVMFESALRRCADHSARGRRVTVFTNVSGNLFRHPELVADMVESASRVPVSAQHGSFKPLVLEITERELFDDPQSAKKLFAPFLELGLGLALDDFGSGYSSFQYLADLPVSFLKIDGRLVQRLNESRIRAIVRGIRNTAFDLGLTTLAEYVENERQANVLREIGIDWAQGHYFSKAMMDESEASQRRHLSANWSQGYYYRRPQTG